ncbi:MAG: hypothetical protein A3C13_04185 [Candidatus Lloydbacteria bacterium RIFCSPHIGHO2_02_FULL_50_11]|nr:MAG: hypothetical protein A3C13_04185 [Candidatus Lloydbacteria bacterium RIFCSPHIGHO2_02_FULL_50_11]
MMSSLFGGRALARKHVWGIVFAFFVGILVLAPQIIFIVNEGSHYKGFYMMKTESEPFYLARMHEFYDEGRIGSPFLFEHKFYGPQFMPSGGETILAIPGKLLGISIPTLNLIYKFLLPAITFLLLYALIFRLTASYAWSIAGGLFFLVGSSWLYAINLSHLLRGDTGFFDGFVYNRPVHPQFDGIITFLYFNVLLSAHKSQSIRWLIILGALLGLSFYTYFYSFTFFLALNFVFAFLWYFSGKMVRVKNLTFATIGGLLIGTPQLLAIYAATQHANYALLASIQPPEYGHMPEISKNGLLVSLIFVAYFFRTKAEPVIGVIREHWLFLAGLLVTTFIVVNQQVITGVSLFSGHYHHTFNIPIFVIVLTFIASAIFLRLTQSYPRFKKIFSALPWIASGIFIATGIFIQYSSYQNWAPQTSREQRYMPAFSWLRGNTAKESVVMANEGLSQLIPVFTENNVMWSNIYAPGFLMPADRAQFTPENLLRSNDFLRYIKSSPYQLDYILWDKEADPQWAIDRFHLPLVFSSEGLIIYQFPK